MISVVKKKGTLNANPIFIGLNEGKIKKCLMLL